jgi:glucan phosphoethanolaminetransferase (alkaline phosphatase superfamily)
MKETLRYGLWAVVATLWTTLCFIVPDFMDSPLEGLYGTCIILAYIGVCGIGSFFLLYAIGCSKYVTAILLPVWALIGAGLAFYRVGYHTTLTPMLLDVTLHTNPEEALGVISWQMILWVLGNLLVAGLLIAWRWTKIQLPKAWLHALIACALGCTYFFCNGRLQNSLCQRFPYNVPFNLHEYASLQRSIDSERRVPDYTVIDSPDSLTIVLILGEAARADHLQLNGYERETTPLLAARTNIVSYPHIFTDQTHTLVSLPYILTRADSLNEDYQYTETSFISIFRDAHYKTAWISNQDMGSTFTHFLAESDTVLFANAGKSVYVFSQWLDEELVPLMNHVFTPRPAHTLYVLHAIGSHWYYNNHVPQDRYFFQPLTSNRIVTANTVEQVVNSYDNTIRYMDYFVDSVITSVAGQKALVIYQADHGEALGEDGVFLHANEAEGSMNPACVIWYSDAYEQAYPDKIAALKANKDKRYRTDYMFYSILSAAGIRAEGYTPSLDIFAQ